MNIVRPARVQQNAVYGGTSYGPRQRLLVEAPGARLMFVPGHSAYLGRASGSKYAAAALWLVRDDMALTRRIVMRKEGVRLSMKLLRAVDVQQAVAGIFGEPVAQALEIDATIVLSEQEYRTDAPPRTRNVTERT